MVFFHSHVWKGWQNLPIEMALDIRSWNRGPPISKSCRKSWNTTRLCFGIWRPHPRESKGRWFDRPFRPPSPGTCPDQRSPRAEDRRWKLVGAEPRWDFSHPKMEWLRWLYITIFGNIHMEFGICTLYLGVNDLVWSVSIFVWEQMGKPLEDHRLLLPAGNDTWLEVKA